MPAGILIPEAVCTCRCSMLVEWRKKGDMQRWKRKRRKEKGRGGEGKREKRGQDIIGEVREEREERRKKIKTKYKSFIYCHAIVFRSY